MRLDLRSALGAFGAAPDALIELEPTRDADRWSRACLASEQPATPFHTFRFLTLVAPMIGHRFTGLIARRVGGSGTGSGGGVDVGVVPWLVMSRGPATIVNRTPFPYVGPLVPRELLLPTLAALGPRARRERVVVQEHQFAPGVEISAAEAEQAGFELASERTFVLDTSREESRLWAGLTPRARANVRKVGEAGVKIAESDEAGRVLDRIERLIYDRKGLPAPYSSPFPPAPAQVRGDGLDARWTLASRDGDPLATLLTLRAGATSGIWVGGVFPEHRKSAVNVALVWDAIAWAREQGVERFDFVGLPDPGIETFKKQFGGELRTYPVLRRYAPGWRGVQRMAIRLDAARRRGAAVDQPVV